MQTALLFNKYSFYPYVQLPFICIKTNLRENRFFATRRTIGGKKSTHNVKILTKKITIADEWTSWQEDKLTSGQEGKLTNGRVGKLTSERVNRLSFGFWHKFAHLDIRNIKKASLLSTHYVPQERCFQLAEKALKQLAPGYLFWGIATFGHRQMGQNFSTYHILVQYFVHDRCVYPGFITQR